MLITESETKQLQEFRDLAVEAADALWAINKGKKPEREPRAINQDVYNRLSRVNKILEKLMPKKEQPKPHPYGNGNPCQADHNASPS